MNEVDAERLTTTQLRHEMAALIESLCGRGASMTASALAERVGASPAYVSAWRSTKPKATGYPNPEHLEELVAILEQDGRADDGIRLAEVVDAYSSFRTGDKRHRRGTSRAVPDPS